MRRRLGDLLESLAALVDDIQTTASSLEEEIGDIGILGEIELGDDPLYVFVQELGIDPNSVEKISLGDRMQMRAALDALKVY